MAEQRIITDGAGVLGDGELHPGKYNMALVRRAIKNGWDVPPEVKRLVVTQMALVVGKSEDERNKIGAAKVLVAADSVDARRESTETPQVHLHAQMGITEVVVEMPDGNTAISDRE